MTVVARLRFELNGSLKMTSFFSRYSISFSVFTLLWVRYLIRPTSVTFPVVSFTPLSFVSMKAVEFQTILSVMSSEEFALWIVGWLLPYTMSSSK